MINNVLRHGNCTSSEIVALVSEGKAKGTVGKPFTTYVEECNMERRLGRSISTETHSKPTIWGNLLERFVFDEKLTIKYSLNSQETLLHPEIDCWAGSPDGFKYNGDKSINTVIDIKCPFTLKSFCQLVQPIYDGLTGMDAVNAIRNGWKDKNGVDRPAHKDGEKYYWQLVSNACISGAQFAELIVFAPYMKDLKTIRERAEGDTKYYSIWASSDSELPYLIEGGYYKDLNTIRFEVPQEDKAFLTERVVMASLLLDKEVNATIINVA